MTTHDPHSLNPPEKHRAPFRLWRVIAILSVILFLAVCVWGYSIITNL
jgi:hypothetical protein